MNGLQFTKSTETLKGTGTVIVDDIALAEARYELDIGLEWIVDPGNSTGKRILRRTRVQGKLIIISGQSLPMKVLPVTLVLEDKREIDIFVVEEEGEGYNITGYEGARDTD